MISVSELFIIIVDMPERLIGLLFAILSRCLAIRRFFDWWQKAMSMAPPLFDLILLIGALLVQCLSHPSQLLAHLEQMQFLKFRPFDCLAFLCVSSWCATFFLSSRGFQQVRFFYLCAIIKFRKKELIKRKRIDKKKWNWKKKKNDEKKKIDKTKNWWKEKLWQWNMKNWFIKRNIHKLSEKKQQKKTVKMKILKEKEKPLVFEERNA